MNVPFEARFPETFEWFDLWHTHVDWKGLGNESSESRREFRRLLFMVWNHLEQLANRISGPWQSWIVLDQEDSSQDAVYLHTPNPNRDNFPYGFEGVTWGIEPPVWLVEFVSRSGIEIGKSEYDDNLLYWIRRTNDNSDP
jgi:hypothetical protein